LENNPVLIKYKRAVYLAQNKMRA